MYKILVDNILMYDSRIEELALINPVVNLEENKAGSFSFKILPNHPYYDLIQRRKSIVQVFQDDEEEPIFSGMCIEITNDFYKQKQIYCEGELAYFNDSVQRQARYQNVTVRGLLENFIAKHNEQVEEAKRFQVGIVTVEDSNDSLYCYTNMESTMKCLKEDLVDDLGGFFRIRHVDGIKYIDYLAESQNTNSQIIKLGKNLLDFSSNLDSSEIATAIIPLGARLEEETEVEGLEKRLTIESVNNGKDYVYSQEAVDSFGWIYAAITWDDVTTAATLKRKAEQYLSEIQFENMVIEAKAVDLHLDNSGIERFKLSDEIRVVSKPHGLDKYFRLSKMTINLNNPESNTITLGKEEKATLSAKTNQENEEIKNAINSFSPNSILNSAINNATQLIKNAMNGYITTVTDENDVPTELLIMDAPDKESATKVWRWNINGLGYSSTGYDGKYALAMTMDGSIVADFIKAGVLTGIEINNGNGTFLVNKNGNVTASRITATTINSAGNVSFKATDTANGGIYCNANIYAEQNITAAKNITSSGGGLSIAGGGSFGSGISAGGTITSLYGGLNANGGGIYSAGDIYSGGDIYAEGTISTSYWSSDSDRNMKQNIEDVGQEEALRILEGVNLRKYQFIAKPDVQRMGFIAQEIQQMLSDNNLDESLFVQHVTNPHTKEEHLGLNYLDMFAVLWKGWQIHNEEIKKLKDEIKILKGE